MSGFVREHVIKRLTRSSGWSKVRKQHLKKNPFCAACGGTKRLEVHHIKPFHLEPELELDLSNLITLCGKYHHFTMGHLMDWRSYNSDVVDDSLSYLYKVNNRP